MQGRVPKVRIDDGRVVVMPKVAVPMVWLPQDGQVVAKIPARKGNRRWLREAVRIRSPHLAEDGRWYLPRNCLGKLVVAAVDRYGYVVVCRDMSRLSRCTRLCLEATGVECNCSCLGAYHGQDSFGWFERFGDVMVADLGEFKRTAVLYGPAGTGADAVVYRGELSGREYRVDRAGRRGWPRASAFMCAGCLSVRAQVWDHCHAHGFVRAPLCHSCNTRHWRGWRPEHGRAAPSRNLDTSYYRWCPHHDQEWLGQCSA